MSHLTGITDVIIPSCKTEAEVQPLAEEIKSTAGVLVRVTATCKPVCAAKNRNLGLDASESQLVVMLDDDVTGLPSGWVGVLRDVMETHPNCVMCSPQLMRPDGKYAPMMALLRGLPVGNGCHPIKGGLMLTACVILRRDELRFDEAFIGSGWEDNDYCRQQDAKYPGCTRLVQHDVQVIHKNEMKHQAAHFSSNRKRYQCKWRRE